jgi:PPOX class probable F420-dependent enzyme
VDQEQRRQFVRDHRTCVFGYNRREHGPAMTVVYYVMDGDDLLISTMADRNKPKAVDRNGRVSLCILNEEWPLGYLQVYGTAVVSRDRDLAADVLTQVIGIMAGEEVPESRRPQIAQMADDEQRVVIRVTPYATFETPPRHVYQMSDLDTLTHYTSTSMPW